MLIPGVDIVEIDRVARVTKEYGKRFLEKIYTEEERLYCRGRAQQLASRFAAKEAVMKLTILYIKLILASLCLRILRLIMRKLDSRSR